MAGVVATGYGGKPTYGGTPFAALAGKAFPAQGGVQSILAAQSATPPRPGPTPAATGATTEAQNQWLAPGNMPIDEGAVAYQRQLEAGKIKAEQDAAAATQANTFKTAGTQQAYDLSQKGADANQNRMYGALDKFGINSLTSQTTSGGSGVPATPPVSGGDAGWGAANAAAIGRAKDTSAAAVGAAERAMQNNMGARGIAGSGIEAKQDMGIQLAGAGQLGAAGRQVAEATAARAGTVADRNYTGEITQRGQDISAADSAAARKQSMLQSLMSLFKVSASY